MDMRRKEDFLNRWRKYFGGAELPITCWYTHDEGAADRAEPAKGHRCFLADLAKIRKGESLRFNVAAIGCGGGKRYLGFAQDVPPDFEHFLSCGIPGILEGVRYKKSPELVKEFEARSPSFTAPARHIVFKRWDRLGEADAPQVAIFFAPPDVLSGLYTLAGFDEADLNAVYCPFCAGCGSIVKFPFLEMDASHPRAVLGMFDVSARPFVPGSTLSFAIPMNKFAAMINNMDESFLITKSWEAVQRRMG
ncbi:MAG TPA: DUF169 domain-containing protein [Geobacteraceae bacterium]|nr:DUF169 domain-containing protein [Geobacteraceae bacterium]